MGRRPDRVPYQETSPASGRYSLVVRLREQQVQANLVHLHNQGNLQVSQDPQ